MTTNEGKDVGAAGRPLAQPVGIAPSQLPEGMIPNVEQRPIFVSLQETRQVMPGTKGRSSRGGTSHHTYAIKFFLVDSAGHQHFAAVGYDGGDSHYQYRNQPEFPRLSCHNKAEVKAWAEEIIRTSQQSSGYRVDVVKDEVPPNGDSQTINLPQFVSYSESKQDMPDGRRQISWYLLDSLGHNHLAIVGHEKDTRDGHYLYRSQSVFDKVVPLEAHNQDEVKKWLNWMIGPRVGPIPVGPASYGRYSSGVGTSSRPMREAKRGRGRSRGRARGSSILGAFGIDDYLPTTTRGRGRGRGRGRPRGAAAFGVEGIRGRGAIARRGRGAFRVYDLDYDSRSVASSEMRKWLAEEVRCREEQKVNAMDFIDDQLPAYEQAILDKNVPKLEKARSKILAKGGKKNANDGLDQDELVDAVGALRELTHLRPTLAMISDEKITSMLKEIMDNGPDILGKSSRALLEKWLHVGTAHAAVFSRADTVYNVDPRPKMECVLQSKPAFDRLVKNVTHRQLGNPLTSLPTPYKPRPGALASGSMPTIGHDLSHVSSFSTGVGACGALASSGVGSEVSDVLEDTRKLITDDEVTILNPYQQQMSMQGIDF